MKSVRSKPTSFGGWKENVKKMCKSDDIKCLEMGHKLWKVRKKPLVGITWHQRKFYLNISELCLYYDETKSIDVANVTEVRSGFSTDTFNEIEKQMKREKKLKIQQLTADHCFSIIFDPRFSGKIYILDFVYIDGCRQIFSYSRQASADSRVGSYSRPATAN